MKILSLPNFFVVIIGTAFFDYDIFVLLSLIALMFLFKSNYKIKFGRHHKKIIILETILFLIVIRVLPIFKNSLLYLYNMFSQQNYLYLDGKFYSENILLDFQTFLFQMYCNQIPEKTNQYYLRFAGEAIECPYRGYGTAVDFISFNGDIWTTTLVFALFSFLLIVWIYLESVKDLNEKSFIFITLFFLSPPFNFALFRLYSRLAIQSYNVFDKLNFTSSIINGILTNIGLTIFSASGLSGQVKENLNNLKDLGFK